MNLLTHFFIEGKHLLLVNLDLIGIICLEDVLEQIPPIMASQLCDGNPDLCEAEGRRSKVRSLQPTVDWC